MIEKTLRYHLQPLVQRRQGLHRARRLAYCWLICAGLGLVLLAADWLWGWPSPWALAALGLIAAVSTGWILFRSYQDRPNYQVMARTIEQQHPDARALILAAIEQTPQGLSNQLGYLQEKVIKEAVLHATRHDWGQSIPTWKLVAVNLGRVCAFVFLGAVLSQMLPAFSVLPRTERGVLTQQRFEVAVTPGDTIVEAGAPVVITVRFDQRVPTAVTLVYGSPDQALQRLRLTKNLDDPVFGGMIPEVLSDMVYHVEFTRQRSDSFHIGVFTHPRLMQADASIIYPDYTDLPEKTIADTRRINVIEGSQVTFTFVLNKAVQSARLAPRAGIGPELVKSKDNPNVLYMVPQTVSETQRYQLHLIDEQGLANKVPPRLEIQVHANRIPELKPVFPKQDVQASALEELSLEAQVEDDYGLIGYGLSFRLAGATDHEIPMDMSGDDGDATKIQYLLALEDLQAKPDQLLSYHFWADDIGPNGQTRRVTSDMYFAEIRPFEEIFRESESFADERQQQQREQEPQSGDSQGQQAEQLARLQKQIIIATWNTQKLVNQKSELSGIKEDLEVVRSSQSDAVTQAGSALTEARDPAARLNLQAATEFMTQAVEHLTQAAAAESDPDLTAALHAEQSAYQELLRLRQREHRVTQSRNQANQAGNPSGNQNSSRSQQQLSQLELKQRQDRYETQRSAQPQQQPAQRENLQVVNRLRDLARRQEEMNKRLKEAQAALNQAQTEEAQQAARRELKRLQDDQTQAVRDVDELQQRMEEPQNRRRMADARERLEQSREGMRQSSEAMEQGQVSSAINSSTRVQRELEEMRDEFQQETSSQFSQEMRDMREQARQLDQQQRQIGREMERQAESPQKTLADSGGNRDLAERLGQQQEQAADLIERMREVSEASDPSEPLLSRKLYDTLRRASTGQVDQGLEAAEELVRRNFLPQAQRIERRAGEGIETMRKGVEEAAESVLGSEAEALRQAREQLDDLIQGVNDEQARATRPDPNDAGGAIGPDMVSVNRRGRAAGDPNETATLSARQQGRGSGDPNETASASANERGRGTRDARDPNGMAITSEGQQGQGARDLTGNRLADGGGGRGRPGPLTGPDYRRWSDDLREVEEMLDESELRNEAARVRERAQTMREAFVRRSETPQWDLVRMEIVGPLIDLRKQVSEKLARLTSDKALVPVDRDPVPERYTELVRRYFETLGDKDQ
jgi:hypothetical protein